MLKKQLEKKPQIIRQMYINFEGLLFKVDEEKDFEKIENALGLVFYHQEIKNILSKEIKVNYFVAGNLDEKQKRYLIFKATCIDTCEMK